MSFPSARATRIWISLVAILTAAVVTGAVIEYFRLSDNGGSEAAATVEAELGTVALTATAAGTVTPVREWSLGFDAEAEVADLAIVAGDVVAEGQVLASSDDANASELVEEAENALEEAEDELDDAEADADECNTGSAASDPSAQTGAVSPTQGGCQSTGTDAILSAQQRVNQAESDLSAAQESLDATVITAPADATVLSVSASEGTVLPAGTVLIELGDLSSVTVESEFSEADAAALAVGQTAAVTIGDADDGIETQIGAISLTGSGTDGLVTYTVSIDLTDPPESVRAGSSATVDVELASVSDVLSVPVSALTDVEGDTALVRVVADDGTEQTRFVDTGLFGDTDVEIRSGLAEGDTVIAAS